VKVSRTAAAIVLAVAACAALAEARQAAPPGARRLATLAALRQFPGYYHLQSVLLRGEFAENGTEVTLRADEREMRAILAEGVSAASGPVEIRGHLIDVGRLEAGDPRLGKYPGPRDPERWPRPGEELILNVTNVTEAQTATTPSVRALALEPWKFQGQTVTVVGQFRGRNILGDLPAAPAKSRYDFVLRSADGAIWVTNLRPRVRNVELSVDARVDTGRWVQVTGTVAQERGLVMIEGTAFAMAAAPEVAPVAEEPPEPELPRLPLEVVFSSPTADETDVPSTGRVRIQFSRGVDPKTIAGQIRVTYLGAAPDAPSIPFTNSYDAASRAIELRFPQPLEAFRTVRVEIREGLRAFDGGVMKPWTLTFSVGQ
jgi:hypothetical protein